MCASLPLFRPCRHLRLRRRKDQQEKSKGGGVGSGALSGSTGGTLVPVQAQRAAARSQQQPAASQQPAANQLPAASSQPPAAARQAPLSHSQQSVPGSGGSTTPLHADPLLHLQLLRQQQQEEQRWLEAQHAAQQAQLLSSLQRRPASREPGHSAALLRGERPPWAPLLPPAAMDAALRCTFTRNCCAKVRGCCCAIAAVRLLRHCCAAGVPQLRRGVQGPCFAGVAGMGVRWACWAVSVVG